MQAAMYLFSSPVVLENQPQFNDALKTRALKIIQHLDESILFCIGDLCAWGTTDEFHHFLNRWYVHMSSTSRELTV